jgi:hypothetical protein
MNKLLTIILIACLILSLVALDAYRNREWDHVASTPEFQALRVKHGLRNTEIVWGSGGKWFYRNGQRQVCRFE